MKLAQSFKYLALGALVAGFYGCGGSNNDQGVSFTNLGFFQFDEDEEFECGELPPIGQFGTTASLGSFSDTSGGVVSALGLQNNLAGQIIRPDRVLLSFYVPGATSNPPSTTESLGGILGPGDGTANESGGSSSSSGGSTSIPTSLPPGFDSICNQGFYNIYVVPPQVMSYISINRADFPEPPFIMEVRVTASGVSSAGDRIESNPQSFLVEFGPDTVINPGSVPDEGADEEGAEEEPETPTL